MIKHLFKLIWNKKKENFLLISEILVSFMVMFAVVSMLVYYYQNYKIPFGFKYEQIWMVSLNAPSQSKDKDSIAMGHESLKNALRNLSKVKEVAYASDNAPFTNNTNMSSIKYKHATVTSDHFVTDLDYPKVMGIKILSGRWFNTTDKGAVYPPLVANTSAVKGIGLGGNPIGKIVIDGEIKKRIIGVIQDFKVKGTFKTITPGMYNLIDTGNVGWMNTLLVKVSPDADARFEDKLYRLIANTTKSGNIEITHLSEMRVKKDKEVLIPLIILIIVSTFLIVNVALGLFGVLWYNISKRRGEIGLRRAIGASGAGVSGQLVGEALVLATFSLIIGVFFAVQFPLLHVFDLPASVYVISILLSILFIYLLVVVCALYPGKQAASIHPAVALHED